MKIFLDTANVEEIRTGASWGVLDGVTTNPSLVAKEGKPFKDVLLEICEIVDGPVNAEVVATDSEGMLKEARILSPLHENIVVKIPMIPEGLKAVKVLKSEGIRTNVTLVFSAPQALLAAKAGASFISPFVGRIDDAGGRGMELVDQIVGILDNYDFESEVLVASIRNPTHVVEAAEIGADIASMPFAVFERIVKHPLTDIGLAKFLADWERVGERIA